MSIYVASPSISTEEKQLPEIPVSEIKQSSDTPVSANIKGYYWVNQSKDIINTRQDLDITERRLIFTIISLVQPDDNEFKTYTFSVSQLAKLIGIQGKSFYGRVEKAINQLQSRQVEIIEGEKKIVMTWVKTAIYHSGEGCVTLKLNEDLAPYLRDLKRAYTKFRLVNVLKLKSEYSWRLYELLKEREFRNERILKVIEIRLLLNIPDDKYTSLRDIKKLLDRCIEELNNKTDIYISYGVYRKLGKSVESFIFNIAKNVKTNVEESEAVMYDAAQIFTLLCDHGIHEKKANQLAKTYHPFYIEENIRHVMALNADNNIHNLPGYVVKAIEGNFASSQFVVPVEDAIYGLELDNMNQSVRMEKEEEVKKLLYIWESFNQVILDRGQESNSADAIMELGKERTERIYQALNGIQRRREKERKPLLLIEDVQRYPGLKTIYEQWEQEQHPF